LVLLSGSAGWFCCLVLLPGSHAIYKDLGSVGKGGGDPKQSQRGVNDKCESEYWGEGRAQ
jgi:hypothetical protein